MILIIADLVGHHAGEPRTRGDDPRYRSLYRDAQK